MRERPGRADAPDDRGERVEEVLEDERLEADALEHRLRALELRDGLRGREQLVGAGQDALDVREGQCCGACPVGFSALG